MSGTAAALGSVNVLSLQHHDESGRSVTADRGWKRPFEDPIPLPRGRYLVPLEDAGKYITSANQQRDRHSAIGSLKTNSPSCQSRNASKATLGVQANIMPKNTAWKVVIFL